MTFKQQQQEIEAGQSVHARINLAKSANEIIEAYQRAYTENVGRKISKADVFCKLITYGQAGLEEERERHLRYAAGRQVE